MDEHPRRMGTHVGDPRPESWERLEHEQGMGKKDMMGRLDEALKGRSPEEIRQRAKEAAAKVTASATGALEGYAEGFDPHAAGMAARKTAAAARAVANEAKSEMPSGGQGAIATDTAAHARRDPMEVVRQGATRAARGVREEMRGRSPAELRESMKRRVGGAMAGASGALEGYAEQADPEAARQAVRKTAETAREVAREAKSEARSAERGYRESHDRL
ncbi:MAG TPA: hypothetical protein VM889_14140 [Candidatus Thermoplasmatota archaeon]|nr:hypothetical protein [Candidatus Thermoplasmatota archaeon]